MSTYKNAYQLLSDVRYGINEHSTAFIDGTDTTGAFQNEYIISKINEAQRYIYSFLFKRFSGFFLAASEIVGVNSVFALPWDCGAVRYFKDENGYRVSQIDVDNLHAASATGSDNLFYRKGNSLVLDRANVSATYTLYYYKKPRDIDQGIAVAGGALSITLASTARKLVDYYNGMIIENITQDWFDTITDYSARVATILETATVDDYYGIVPDMPEMFHEFIAPIAVYKIKLESPVTQEAPKQGFLGDINESLLSAARSYSDISLDVTAEEIFCDFGSSQSVNYNIPGY